MERRSNEAKASLTDELAFDRRRSRATCGSAIGEGLVSREPSIPAPRGGYRLTWLGGERGESP